jgi:hypothetical protein
MAEFFLNDCNFVGPLPDVSRWTSINQFDIGSNKLVGGAPNTSAWSHAYQIQFSQNYLQGPLIVPANATSTLLLYIFGNQLSGAMPQLPSGCFVSGADCCSTFASGVSSNGCGNFFTQCT